MTNAGFPAVPAPEFADPLPGYSYVGEQCIAASYRIPEALKQRVNGLVRYAGDTGKIPGIQSQTDLIRVAGHCYVTQLEQQFNNGQTFPDPATNNHRGRGPDHPGQSVKIGFRLPTSLHRRIMGAACFLDDTGAVPGVTSANRLVTMALEVFLNGLERDHNLGRHFHDPRRHLPKGRLSERRRHNDTATIFLAASIPTERWGGRFDADEIVEAVVTLARACLARGYRLVAEANPTITPSLLGAAVNAHTPNPPTLLLYQSERFEDVLLSADRQFEFERLADVTWTQAIEGKEGLVRSVALLREQMLSETDPVAAIFIGGMDGSLDQFELYRRSYPDRATYAAGNPGGSALSLVHASPNSLRGQLSNSREYEALWCSVLDDILEPRVYRT